MMARQDNRLAHSGSFRSLEEQFLLDLAGTGPLDPSAVWVLVPSLDVRRRLRKRMADSGRPAFNVRFVLFPDLAREILASAPAGEDSGRTLLDTSSSQVLLRALVARVLSATSYFGDVRDRGGFVEALAATLDDLDHAGVEPGTVAAAAGRVTNPVSARKLAEVARIQADWRKTLSARGYMTAAGLLTAAALRAVAFPASSLHIYGFYDLNGVQKELLEALFRDRTITVYFPAGSGHAAYSEPLRQWFTKEGFRFSDPPPADRAVASPVSGSLSLFSAAGERREVEEAGRRILSLLAGGTRPDAIAVIYRNAEPYAELLRSTLTRAKIPAEHHDRMALSETRVARALRLFVAAALSGGSRRPVMDFLDVTLPIHPRLAADGVGLAATWEGLTIRAGISRRMDRWIPRLERLRELRRHQDETKPPDGGPAAPDTGDLPRQDWLIRAIDGFLPEIRGLFQDFEAFLAASTWSARTACLLETAERWIGSDPLRETILMTVNGLAGIDRTGEPAGAELFRTALEDLLAGTVVDRDVPQRAPVHVGDVLSIRGLFFEHVFLLGMGEKIFPRAPREDPILLDRERQALRAAGADLDLKSRGVEEEAFLFELVRAAAGDLSLSWSRIEPTESRPRLPSPYLMKIASEYTGQAVDYAGLDRLASRVPLDLMARARAFGRKQPADFVPMDGAPFLDASVSLDATEFDTYAVAVAAGAERFERVAGLAGESPVLVRAITGEVARWRDRSFTRYDGMIESPKALAALAGMQPKEFAYSASRLEKYARCPFQYFVENVLGVESRGAPEDQDGANPMDRGTLIHAILHEFLSAQPGGRLEPGNRDALCRSLEAVAGKQIAAFERDYVTGYPAKWGVEVALLLDEIRAWLDFELGREAASPSAGFEVSFGDPPKRASGDRRDAVERNPGVDFIPVRLELPNGRQVAFHGRIDRFDFDPVRKHARVVDYKSGRPPRSTEQRGMDGGRALQLPVYVHALSSFHPDVKTAEAEYLFLRTDSMSQRYPVENFDRLRKDLAGVVAPLVDGIESGRFFPLPTGCIYRERCRLSSICGVRISDRFARKSRDPRIASHPAFGNAPEARS